MCVYYVYILPNRSAFARFTASWSFFSVLESWRLGSAGSTCPHRFSTQQHVLVRRFRKPFEGIASPFRYTLPFSEFLKSLEIKCRERTLLFFVTRKSFPSSLLIACSHRLRLVLSVRKLKYDIFPSLSPQ